MKIYKNLLRNVVLGVFALGASAAYAAETYPQRPIKIVVPYQPGSAVDTTSRKIADQLSKRLNQPVVVENKTGAFGLIALKALRDAPADGYTLMVDTPAMAINPSVRKVDYDPYTDIQPIAQLMALPFVIGVNPAVPAKNLEEFIAYGKKNEGKMNIAEGGTSTLLTSLLFGMETGVKMQTISYKGAAPAVMAVLQNECQVIAIDLANLATHIQAGKMIGLLTTGDKRSPMLPDVPTAKEVGLDNFNVSTWFGLFAKKGTPQEILDKLNAVIGDTFNDPDYKEYVEARGATLNPYSVEEFTQFFNNDVKTWAKIVKDSGVKFEQ